MSSIDFGINRQHFLGEHYDKLWFLQRRAFTENRFKWSDLDNALYGWEPSAREIRLIHDGSVSLDRFTEPYMEGSERRTRIIKDVLYQYMKDGATLILNKLQLHSAVIHDYCMTIAQFIGEKTNANAYAAFGGDGAFDKHWDRHDVFVLQLIGRKRWKLYQPTFEKPLDNHLSRHHKHESPQEPVLDTVLEAGDLLYIPRGWWHEALPLENEPTFHIAVGAFPPRVIDYLIWVCALQLPNYVEGRQSLNPYLDADIPVQAALDRINCLLNNAENYKKYLQYCESGQRVNSRFDIARLAKQYEKNTTLSCSNNVARLNSFFPVSGSDESLIVNGIKLNVDEQSRTFFEELAVENSAAIKQLYTTSEHELLNQLGEYDVVEWIER